MTVRNYVIAAAALGLCLLPAYAADDVWQSLFPSGPAVEEIAGDFQFTEGPVWIDAKQMFVFSDIPRETMYQWSRASGFSVFRSNTGNANGNTCADDGRIYSCEHGTRSVTVTENGVTTTVADRFDGKRFNSPNDIVIAPDGSLWFTDPDYGLLKRPREILHNGVYRIDVKTGAVSLITAALKMPNGLCFSPDGNFIYIADAKPDIHSVWRFPVSGGGIGEGALFYSVVPGIPDGMRCDPSGRLWIAAGDGIHVVSADGNCIGRIMLRRQPTNLCFGGSDGKTLFITARSSVYVVPLAVSPAGRK